MSVRSKHGTMAAILGSISLPVGAASVFAGTAWAHPPFCICKTIDATTIRCEGGFADGTGVPGARLDVVRYDESIVLQTSFGADSTVSFRKPDGSITLAVPIRFSR